MSDDEIHSHRTSAALEALADAARERQRERTDADAATARERLRTVRNPDKQAVTQALRRHLTR